MAINNQPRNYQFWSAINATPNDFNCDAGLYGMTLHATVWGSAQLQKLLPDGATYVAVTTIAGVTNVVADGYVEYQLPAGQYRLSLTGVTGLTGEIAKIASGAG